MKKILVFALLVLYFAFGTVDSSVAGNHLNVQGPIKAKITVTVGSYSGYFAAGPAAPVITLAAYN